MLRNPLATRSAQLCEARLAKLFLDSHPTSDPGMRGTSKLVCALEEQRHKLHISSGISVWAASWRGKNTVSRLTQDFSKTNLLSIADGPGAPGDVCKARSGFSPWLKSSAKNLWPSARTELLLGTGGLLAACQIRSGAIDEWPGPPPFLVRQLLLASL